MTEDEFKARRKKDACEIIMDTVIDQAKVDSMSNREFLTAMSRERIGVEITNRIGKKVINIVARMPKSGMKRHETFISQFRAASRGDIDALVFLSLPEGDKATAEFMADITTDPELDTEFWMSDNIDYIAVQKILVEYFKENPLR